MSRILISAFLMVAVAVAGAETARATEEKVSVHFQGIAGEADCRFSHDVAGIFGITRHYLCGDPSRPTILIRTDREWWALGTDSLGKPRPLAVESARSGETVLYGASEANSGTVGQSEPSLKSDYQNYQALLLMLEGVAQDGPQAFLKGVTRLQGLAEGGVRKIEEVFRSSKRLEVELADGRRARCMRPQEPLCPYLTCDPIQEGGRSFEPLLLFPGDAAVSTSMLPTLTLSRPGEMGRGAPVRRIRSAEGVVLVAEDSPQLATPTHESLRDILPPAIAEESEALGAFLNPAYEIVREAMMAPCEDERVRARLAQESAAAEKFKEQVAALEVVQLVSKTSEAFWGSRLMANSLLPADACHLYGNVFLDRGAAERFRDYEADSSSKEPQAIPLAQADELFREMAAMKDIPFAYVNDGCYARAHVMADRLRKKGVDSEKLWILGSLRLKGAPDVRWEYHVAPVVRVRLPNGKVEQRVLDPSLAKVPLRPEEWVSRMEWQGAAKPLSVGFPPPGNARLFQRPVLMTSPSEVYHYDDSPKDARQRLQQTLRQADEVNRSYRRQLPGAPAREIYL